MEQTLSTPSTPQPATSGRAWLLVGAAAVAWLIAYNLIQPLADWLTYGLLGLARGSHLGDSLAFFLYDVPKILLLLSGMIFLIAILRSFFSPERTRALLGGKREGVGNVLAAGAGHRHPLLLLLGGAAVHRLRGVGHSAGRHLLLPDRRADDQRGGGGDAVRPVRLAGGRALRRLPAWCIAIVAGLVIGRLKLERYVEDFVWQMQGRRGGAADETLDLDAADRLRLGSPCRRSSARSGSTWWSASRWARASTATCRRTSWRASWARRPGGRCRRRCCWASRCTPTRPGSSRSCRR